MKRSLLDFLEDMLRECTYLLERSKGMTYKDFVHNEDLKRAFIRSLEVIGEAAKKVAVHLSQKYPEVPWRDVAGMRDKLIHDYFGVSEEVVWKTVVEDIPLFFSQIRGILEKERGDLTRGTRD